MPTVKHFASSMEIMNADDTPPPGPDVNADIERATESLTKLAVLRNKVWQCGFPPLPVLVNNFDADCTFTSSYNLLMTIFQNQAPEFYAGQDKRTFCKNQIYPAIRMHTELKAFVVAHESSPDELKVYIHNNTTILYNVMLSCFRVYVMNMLQNKNIDLRFRGHEDVTRDDAVCREMQQWLLESCGLDCKDMSFTAMIQKFVFVSVTEHENIVSALNMALKVFE